MKVPHSASFFSSVLFTIALACLIPSQLSNALAGNPNPEMGASWIEISRLMHYLGIASLAIIAVGLVVTWAGYVQRLRWTWFVMFIIVWGWAFPLMIRPTLGSIAQSMPEWLPVALREPGLHRDLLKEVMLFVLMLIALLLPIKSLLSSGRKFNGGKPGINRVGDKA